MAQVTNCQVCGKSVVDIGIHPECQVAFLSDLLYQVQRHVHAHPEQPLPGVLRLILTKNSFKPLSEFRPYPENETHNPGILADLDGMARLSQMVVGPGRVDPFMK